jgi:hypothetical protein
MGRLTLKQVYLLFLYMETIKKPSADQLKNVFVVFRYSDVGARVHIFLLLHYVMGACIRT